MSKRAGFTLIELITVVVLIMTLAGLATTRFVQSYQARSVDHFVKEFVFFLRYIQFKSIEEGAIHKLVLDPDSGELKSFIKLTVAPDNFKETSIPFVNRFQKRARFVLQLKNGNEVYFFPDGGVTPNQFLVMEGMKERASIDIKDRLGFFQVVHHD